MTIDEMPKYAIDLTRKTISVKPEDFPEVPDLEDFIETMRIRRNYDDVLTQMELEGLWNEDIATGAVLVDYTPVGIGDAVEVA